MCRPFSCTLNNAVISKRELLGSFIFSVNVVLDRDFMSLKDAKVASEAELEEILNNNSDMIEEGFRMLRTQKRTTPYGKRLDLLGVDSNGTLTVVELKVREDDNQLPQAIEYFD